MTAGGKNTHERQRGLEMQFGVKGDIFKEQSQEGAKNEGVTDNANKWKRSAFEGIHTLGGDTKKTSKESSGRPREGGTKAQRNYASDQIHQQVSCMFTGLVGGTPFSVSMG